MSRLNKVKYLSFLLKSRFSYLFTILKVLYVSFCIHLFHTLSISTEALSDICGQVIFHFELTIRIVSWDFLKVLIILQVPIFLEVDVKLLQVEEVLWLSQDVPFPVIQFALSVVLIGFFGNFSIVVVLDPDSRMNSLLVDLLLSNLSIFKVSVLHSIILVDVSAVCLLEL